MVRKSSPFGWRDRGHVHHVCSTVVVVVDILYEVRRLLLDSPEYRDAAEEVVSYLTLVRDRSQHVDHLAGAPRLLEAEVLSQSFAGLFHRHVFTTVEMASAEWVADLLGPAKDVRGLTRRLRQSSEVVAVKDRNTFVYPKFQFDPERRRVREPVGRANRLLLAKEDPWGALAWWLAEQPRWGMKRPIDHPDDRKLMELVEADSDDSF